MSTNPTPNICRIVRYRLSGADAQEINHERADSMLAKRGGPVQAGDEFPMMIVKVWGDTPESAVNGVVFLDGNHTFWATSVLCGEGERTFSWPNASHGPGPRPQYETPSIKQVEDDPRGPQQDPAGTPPPPPPGAQS